MGHHTENYTKSKFEVDLVEFFHDRWARNEVDGSGKGVDGLFKWNDRFGAGFA